MNAVGILLAAGRGQRFDPSGVQNTLLQVLSSGDAVVVASARHLLAVLPRVVAVVRPEAVLVAQALAALGCEVTVCPGADSGMAASLVHGIEATLDAQCWLIALADMPAVQEDSMRSILAAIEDGCDIACPTYLGRRGNPVAFGRRHLPLLLALAGEQGARSILKNHPVREVAVQDPGVVHDIDTPADLSSQ